MGPGLQSRLAVLASLSLPALALVAIGVAWVRRQRRRKLSTSGCPPEPVGSSGEVDQKIANCSPCELVPSVVAKYSPESRAPSSEIAAEAVAEPTGSLVEVAKEATTVFLADLENSEVPAEEEVILEIKSLVLLSTPKEEKEEEIGVATPTSGTSVSECQSESSLIEEPIKVSEEKDRSVVSKEALEKGQELSQLVKPIVHRLPDTPPASPPPSNQVEVCSKTPESVCTVRGDFPETADSTVFSSPDSVLSGDLEPVSEEPKEVAPQQTDDGGAAVAKSAPPPREKFISERVIITTGRDIKETTVPSAPPVTVPIQPQGKGGKKGKKAKRRRAMDGHGDQLAEKLASLELSRSERDSANQSPCDGMLASPGAYSDARSDGSSDSGKGHSDVATPAASLAGDPAPPTVYEFLVPQTLVGRLIGRHGSFLQEIMALSHTNIFIKKHPESNKLKICAIEGGQPDIDKALDIIRKKFPSRRYPKLTLERVTFVNIERAQLRSEDFHLALVEGVNNDIVVSSLMTAGHLFVQQPSHPSYLALTALTQAMGSAYSDPLCHPPPLVSPVKDAVCVAPSMGGWYRVQIVAAGSEVCQIKFVDYGGYLDVETAALRQIRGDFLMLPFQAVECILANIRPIDDLWSEEARVFVHQVTFGRVLQAFVCSYAPQTGIPHINLFTSLCNQVVLVNDELVRYGFARPVQETEEGYADEDVMSEETVTPQPIAAE